MREQGEQLPLQVGAAEQGQVRVSSPPRAQLVRLWAQPIPLAQVAHSAAGQPVVAMAAVSTPVWAVWLESRAQEAWSLPQAVAVPAWGEEVLAWAAA